MAEGRLSSVQLQSGHPEGVSVCRKLGDAVIAVGVFVELNAVAKEVWFCVTAEVGLCVELFVRLRGYKYVGEEEGLCVGFIDGFRVEGDIEGVSVIEEASVWVAVRKFALASVLAVSVVLDVDGDIETVSVIEEVSVWVVVRKFVAARVLVVSVVLDVK
mmetsp:Transcript_13822/g.18160  ORF Transcript_13822/g.18160 Transcript_13822/m.18160 type:complete len:159 (-) Transcript_13822:30-506(-)